MMDVLDRILESFRANSRTEREKGAFFERLTIAYLTHDPLHAEEYEAVLTFSEWAQEHGWVGKDTGIDLVAKLRNGEGYAAIQCKFYSSDHHIQKSDIDSFISASGKSPFRRRLIIDTSHTNWSDNAEEMIRGQDIPVIRIGLTDLRASRIDWTIFESRQEVVLRNKKTLLPHQKEALIEVRNGLSEDDRGKLIMACGTGKTFTSLKIAEDLAGAGKRVLFMVPSLALMAQTVREWVNDADLPLRSFAVCSDIQVGKRRKSTDDVAEIDILDLAFPATTDAERLTQEAKAVSADKMTVMFATYQSIDVLSRAQKEFGLPVFDLIVCDEAHRTTGVTLSGEDDSNFVKIHSNAHIQGKKRLYMTATPRIFGDAARTRANEVEAVLASMDDETLFGKTLFYRGFSWAVENGLLTDYKVIVLAMDEGSVSSAVQKRLNDANSELLLDDATKIVGCYKALMKTDFKADVTLDPHPMKRALAFCKSIAASKLIRNEFSAVIDEYHGAGNQALSSETPESLQVEIDHVDGTFNAKSRDKLLDWLKAETNDKTCRILTNARCLSEGVDVPALDAIIFMHPRKSQIDVVQSVGRVMRRASGKKMGYVILPVGVPVGISPERALYDNEKYRVIWQILNALRAHDDRFDATINKASLGQDISQSIEIIGVTQNPELKAVTSVVDELPMRSSALSSDIGQGESDSSGTGRSQQLAFTFPIDEFTRAIMAKIVKKCGTRDYWEDWAGNIAEIAQTHITRLTGLLKDQNTEARRAFDDFLNELRDDLNNQITEAEAIEMLAQHIITRPVFEVLFEGHRFIQENPVSRAMQKVLSILDKANLDKESKDLEKFYASVQTRATGITDPQAKQRLIVELYDKFFRKAFPRTTEKLGIVYTPVEIVDFIIHSVNEVLKEEFGQTLGAKGVHIIDPFTGTGTFITRLLQSGLIDKQQMERKYRQEIHANEIVLLAYYIAAINIEATYHGIMGGDYVPFEGICLTDTFQMYESNDLISHYMPDNSKRRKRQKELDIRVVMGNPPYSAGQGNANDNNANIAYPSLDARIRETYAARSTATNKNALYDSYIRAIRWGSDRLGEAGVMAYVTGGAWVERQFADGMRQSLAEEFSAIYVFHLRGDIRKNMLSKGKAREGGNVFGSGSMTGITITLFVKSPNNTERGRINFYNIGDDLSQQEKLKIIHNFNSISGIRERNLWTKITPDQHHDWINQRDNSFSTFIKIGDKKDSSTSILFDTYSSGVKTQRDAWCYNSSKENLRKNINKIIDFFNSEIIRYKQMKKEKNNLQTNDFINTDSTKISWSDSLKWDLEKENKLDLSQGKFVQGVYRPFTKQWLYFGRRLNERVYRIPRLFPTGTEENRVICVTGTGGRAGFSALMMNRIPCLDTIEKGQCFPLKIYDNKEHPADEDLFSQQSIENYSDGISDAGLKHFQTAYPDETIAKEDIFYYVYGLLHCEDYRARYADNLTKELPRIPCVKTAKDFWAFSRAGRELGDLHVNYESVKPYPVSYKQGDPRTWVINDPISFYRVTKWAFGKAGKDKDKTIVIYNSNITMIDIPLEAYDYVVNGKPALEWVMERQVVKTDKDSGIVNDANLYAVETIGNPAYPLELFQRVITVSLRTIEIVRGLPKLDL